MQNSSAKTRAIRRSNLVCIIIFAFFGVLLLRILFIQTVDFEKYQEKVVKQMTTESPVPANRGKIYDKNGNILATNVTTYRVFISPSGIRTAEAESKVRYADGIAKGLSALLDNVTYEDVYKQITEYADKLDRTIARKVDEAKADEIRKFISENDLHTMVYLEAQSTRYYPAGSLAAHAIGFTSTDGVGLYGLELQYDEYLGGVDGYYIKARDSYGNVMPFEYASYIDAIDGYNLTTTIDATIQSYLEAEIAATVEEHEVTNRACGIIVDVNTGAILAMATSSPFDLNNPWGLDEKSQQILNNTLAEGYTEDSDEYNDISRALLTTMWSNKAVTESYIPGSTFKIITSSMALEEKLVNLTESIVCPGYRTLYGHKIHCDNTAGHGTLSFPTGLQQSCNVWFMELGGRLGIQKYKNYVEMFGYTEKTGIDLPGEGSGIFASQMTDLDLAIYAFGQNFNVTPMQQLTAIASVANGGTLITPYLVEKVTDNAGNVIFQHELQTKRGTVSKDTCETVAKILEDGVSGNGGAKNTYVAGYRVAAKTGTAEKKERECPKCGYTGVPVGEVEGISFYACSVCGFRGEKEYFEVSEKYVCSTVAFAPADDPQIAIIILADEPTRGALYGSTVAAPYVANVLENTMPYLGIEAKYSESDLAKLTTKVGSYRGWSIERATEYIEERGLKVKVVGSGEKVTAQMPKYGEYIEKSSGTIILYADAKPTDNVAVPLLVGKNPTLANQILAYYGLNIKIEGDGGHSTGTEYQVVSQSIAEGTLVPEGTVITVKFKKVS
jgi:stage V sporulation protein D (sporulation-specific penicillin-binding protein)